MTEAENEQIAALKEDISGHDGSQIEEIPFELLEKRGKPTTKLIATSGEVKPLDGRRRWYDFRFKEPFLVTKVTVNVSGYGEFRSFGFAWETENGKIRETDVKPENGLVSLVINDICRRISFQPPSVFFAATKINLVSVEGIQLDDVPAVLEDLSNLDALKSSILAIVDKAISRSNAVLAEAQKARQEREVLQKEITNHKNSVTRLKKSIDELALQKNELIAHNGVATSNLADLESRHSQLTKAEKLLNDTVGKLRETIAIKEGELKSLKNNINLFPTEIVEFVNQGSKNVQLYFGLALVPILIIGIMFVLLVNGAINLTTVVTSNPDVNIQVLLLSRLPYVTVATVIITACYKISRAFFNELFRINSQRLNLTKISIIAKDVSSASEHGLDLSDEDTYRLRTELKMALLREHLKDYISKDFKTEMPKRLFGLLPYPNALGGLGDDDDPKASTA